MKDGLRRAEVRVPKTDGRIYMASNQTTGETLMCTDIAPLLRRVAESYLGDSDSVWKIINNAGERTQ